MTDLSAAIAALRAERDANASIGHEPVSWFLVDAALTALDAAQGEAVAWKITLADNTGTYDYAQWAGLQAPQAPPAAVANVTPLRQPRADLARLVESINAAVYANGDGLSVTEAIGALELAKLELLKEQEQ